LIYKEISKLNSTTRYFLKLKLSIMINLYEMTKKRSGKFFYLIAVPCFLSITLNNSCKSDIKHDEGVEHVIVYYEDGRFGGWPANGGMWAWDDEILVCHTVADHKDQEGHTYDNSTARNMFSRSLDGGKSWTLEDAYQQGITGEAHIHRLGDMAVEPEDLIEPMDFTHSDFALLFQNMGNPPRQSHFYYTYNRGKSWNGPFILPNLDTPGLAARTDYIIDGKHEMLIFVTAAKSNGAEGWVTCMGTVDGGMTWERKSWIGPEPDGFSIIPTSLRLKNSEIISIARFRGYGITNLTNHISQDNGITWQQLEDPVKENLNSPGALIQLTDGRLVLAYAKRQNTGDGSSICVRISSDDGRSWSEEIVLREKEGANSDIGYPQIVKRSDGKLVITYYWNHSLLEGKPPYRYIASTIWDPAKS